MPSVPSEPGAASAPVFHVKPAALSIGAPSPPAVAAQVFGARLPLAVRYADWLATAAVERGLIGPREVSRVWERHLLNCAVVASLLPTAGSVVDVGSGAGLPGLPLAIARPDLKITLVDPLLRRSRFLTEVVADLGLTEVEVLRARAEDLHPGRGKPASEAADVVTARAVAPLARLVGWTLPLLRPGGELVALKGASAPTELTAAAPALSRLGVTHAVVDQVGSGLVEPPTTVIRVRAPLVEPRAAR